MIFTSNDIYCLLTNCIHMVILNIMGVNMDIVRIFFDELKKYRTAIGLSQEAFSNKVGLQRT